MKHATGIQELLDRYWEGETTLEEERRLREFFSADPVPEQFRREAELFRVFRSEQSVRMPERPGIQLPAPARRLYRWAAAASVALFLATGAWWMTRPAETVEPEVGILAPKSINDMVQLSGVVPGTSNQASLPTTTGTTAPDVPGNAPPAPSGIARPRGHSKSVRPEKPHPSDTIEDPEQAMAEIRAALDLISSKIGKGKKEIGKGWHEVETLDKIIRKKSDG